MVLALGVALSNSTFEPSTRIHFSTLLPPSDQIPPKLSNPRRTRKHGQVSLSPIPSNSYQLTRPTQLPRLHLRHGARQSQLLLLLQNRRLPARRPLPEPAAEPLRRLLRGLLVRNVQVRRAGGGRRVRQQQRSCVLPPLTYFFSLFPFSGITRGAVQLTGGALRATDRQISSATFTRASSTKIRRKRPATRSTVAGTPRGPSTANSRPSPISEKRAVGSTAGKAA